MQSSLNAVWHPDVDVPRQVSFPVAFPEFVVASHLADDFRGWKQSFFVRCQSRLPKNKTPTLQAVTMQCGA